MPDDSTLRHLSSGVQGDVYLVPRPGSASGAAVVKIVHAPKDGDSAALRPHNIVREARILRDNPHGNLVTFLEYGFDAPSLSHRQVLEALPLELTDVLSRTRESPIGELYALFKHASRGVFSALGFLHSHGIAHRDIKPANVLYASDGTPKLIDLATAWDGSEAGDDGKGGMTCSVGTGPYRAPELLFGSERYDAFALDLWAAGATLAEFFRPTRRPPSSSSSGGSSNDSASSLSEPESHTDDGPAPLFNASFGDLGLAGSMFRLLGTPTEQTWPTFTSLPDAGKVHFVPREPRPLSSELSIGDDAEGRQILQTLEGLLHLEPSHRTQAANIVAALAENTADSDALGILRPWLDRQEAAWRCPSPHDLEI